MSPPACAYLVSRYPTVTHTFVLTEVAALRGLGVRVEPASVRRASDAEAIGPTHRAERERTRALLPVSPGYLAAAHLRALVAAPRAYLRTLAAALRLAHAGGRPRLWQLFYFGEAILLARWMREVQVRHVHVHHANVAADVALLACRYAAAAEAPGPPPLTWSLTVHGPTELVDLETHKLAVKASEAALVVCISDFARGQVEAVVPSAALPHVTRVRCGIDVDRFVPGAREAAAGAPTELLCVAALSRRKGHRVLLAALAQVRADGVALVLRLAGDGPERPELERLAAELGVGEAVTFLGAVPSEQVPALYRAADAFCLPSASEGLPTVLMEAMACELPVVACRVAGTPELVEDGVSGLLVSPARPDELAAALSALAADPALRRRLGRAGRERVLAEYDARDAARTLRDALLPLL